MKAFIGWTIVVLVVLWIINNPDPAAPRCTASTFVSNLTH
jgi:hypothetical protein